MLKIKQISKISLAIMIVFVSGLFVVSCKAKDYFYVKPTYNYYSLEQSFKKESEEAFHESFLEKKSNLIYVNTNYDTSYSFFDEKVLKNIQSKKDENINEKSYEILSKDEKANLSKDLKSMTERSYISDLIKNKMSNKLTTYKEILKFESNTSWFTGIEYNYDYFDFSYSDLSDGLYIASVELDLTFKYQFVNIYDNLIKENYKEPITITITNYDEILEQLNYVNQDLTNDLLIEKFDYAWFDASKLLINDYEKMFNLSSPDFEKLLSFNKFENSLIKFINSKQNKNDDEIKYEFVFANDNRFLKYKKIEQINSFDLSKENHLAKFIDLDDSNSSENWRNIQLFQTIFSSMSETDVVILENKKVKANQSIYDFMKPLWIEWVKELHSKFTEKFNIKSNSVIEYGEIYLKNMKLYFPEIDYYHPIQQVSYYSAISIDDAEDSYLFDKKYEWTNNYEVNSIFKAIYLNTYKSVQNFQKKFQIKENRWIKISESNSWFNFNPLIGADFWDFIGQKRSANIFDVNENLCLISNNKMIEEERNIFLTDNNNSYFKFEILPFLDKENYILLDINSKRINFKGFKTTNPDKIKISFGISFININFIINEEKFYLSEKTLMKK